MVGRPKLEAEDLRSTGVLTMWSLAITPTIAEWKRGRSDVRDRIKMAVPLVPFPLRAAEAAGVALGQIRGERKRAKLSVDVMVMAFAATYGGALVYTSDLGGLQKLSRYFPEVRLLAV